MAWSWGADPEPKKPKYTLIEENKDMGKKDKDEDIEETSSWSCSICGAGGSCVKGDEATAEAAHKAMVH